MRKRWSKQVLRMITGIPRQGIWSRPVRNAYSTVDLMQICCVERKVVMVLSMVACYGRKEIGHRERETSRMIGAWAFGGSNGPRVTTGPSGPSNTITCHTQPAWR